MNKEKQTTIFIDTEDMEERYAQGLYVYYLKEENQQLKDRINKAIEFIRLNFCNKEDIFDCWHSDIKEIIYILKEND